MEEDDYIIELRRVLDENSAVAVNNLNLTIQSLPEKTHSIVLMISPDQDGEGTFGVRVSISGPDLYVLNKAIKSTADLINIIHTPEGVKPNVPLMDPDDSSFEVNDILSDEVGDWLKSVWDQADNDSINLPVTIESDEGYVMNLPIRLN
ncbi:MAG: hypothetical protein HEP71_27215 [Roseivirga sp.]|nr:hypothetical protein [Roseivirga sp.]